MRRKSIKIVKKSSLKIENCAAQQKKLYQYKLSSIQSGDN